MCIAKIYKIIALLLSYYVVLIADNKEDRSSKGAARKLYIFEFGYFIYLAIYCLSYFNFV